jgi:poly-beta-1,6-N-acetyl-D-glucosamine N-deacetylase
VHTSMSISVEAFEEQLNYLEHSGYKVISLEDLAHCLDTHQSPPDKSVAIAIDDGWATVMKAFPVLVRHNMPFSVFLPMAFIANPYSKSTLSQADIDALRAYPKVTFGDHSWLHSPRLAKDEAYAREDIRKSREKFHQIFGYDTKFFAYPYGRTSETYARLLHEAGFEYFFVTGDNPATAATSKTAIPRIAANRLSLTVLASVLREHEAYLARAKSRPTPNDGGPLLTETRPAEKVPRLVE